MSAGVKVGGSFGLRACTHFAQQKNNNAPPNLCDGERNRAAGWPNESTLLRRLMGGQTKLNVNNFFFNEYNVVFDVVYRLAR